MNSVASTCNNPNGSVPACHDAAFPMLSETPDGNRRRIFRNGIFALLLFYLFAYLLPLAARPMVRPDEFRYAEIPREMIARQDWTVPRLLGFRYFEKPALGYQLTALSFSLLGENHFALRLPSALGTGLAAIFLFILTALRTRNVWLPLLSTAIFLSSGLVYGIGTFAVLDSPLLGFLTASLVSFFLSITTNKPCAAGGWMLLSGAMAGAAFLVKGFLGLVVPIMVVLPFLCRQRGNRHLLRDGILFSIAALAVALPWSLAIWRKEPDFWRYFIVMEHFQRFTSHTYDRSREPVWYFIPVLLGGMLPSGFLWLATRGGWSRTLLKTPLFRYALCWAAIPFLFFSISSCKLGTYILPCFPALALLLGIILLRAIHTRPIQQFRRFLSCSGYVYLTIFLLAWLMFLFRSWHWENLLLPQLALLAGIIFALCLIHANRWPLSVHVGIFLLGIAPALCLGLHAIPAELFGNKMPEAMVAKGLTRLALQEEDVLMADHNTAVVAAWFLKRTDILVVGNPGECTYAVGTYPTEYAGRWIENPKNMAAHTPIGHGVYLSFKKPGDFVLPENRTVLQDISTGPLRRQTRMIRF